MNRFHPAVAAVLFTVALGACDRRDDDENMPSETGVPDAAATAGGSVSGDSMASASRPSDTTASGGTGSPSDGMSSDGMSAGNMASGGAVQDGATSVPDPMNNPSGTATADGTSATRDASATGNANAAGTADSDFYRQALGSGASEVALSEHAARTSSSAEVKRIAEMLVADHRELNGKLRTASGMGEMPPPATETRAADDIKAKTGTEFDTAYLRKMSEGHKKSIALYQAASTGARDAETRRLASATLPKLREHAGHVEKALTAASRNNR